VTNISLPVTGNPNGRRRRLSAQYGKLNIVMLSALAFSRTNFVISVPGNREKGFKHL